MKSQISKFLDKHGERLFFMTIAFAMAMGFWYMTDLREAGKTILIGIAMLCYNKARSGEDKSTSYDEGVKGNEIGFANVKILLFFVMIGMLVLSGCAGFKDKSISGKATQTLLTTKSVVVNLGEVANKMCQQGVLTQERCDKISILYAKAGTAYDTASDLLAIAVKIDTPDAWSNYRKALVNFLEIYSNLTKIGAQYNIYNGDD